MFSLRGAALIPGIRRSVSHFQDFEEDAKLRKTLNLLRSTGTLGRKFYVTMYEAIISKKN